VPPEAGGPGSTPFDSTAPPDVPIRMITRLVVVGENIQLDLPPEQERFTLGAASAPIVDLTLHGEMVSRLHAVLTRTGAKLRVVDQRSTNGTFFQGHRDADFELSPGQVFEVSRRVKLLALDPGLAILRNRLLWVVGLRNRAAADAAIQVIAANAPLLLLGPPGCEQHATAAEIHRRSAFNDREFVIAPTTFASRAEQDQLLARGTRSTVFLDLSRPTAPMPAHFVGHLFADCRPIIAAPTRERAVDVLDSYARRLQEIELATPAERPDDIPRLLDALIVEEHARAGGGDLLPLAALGAANLDGLKAHTVAGSLHRAARPGQAPPRRPDQRPPDPRLGPRARPQVRHGAGAGPRSHRRPPGRRRRRRGPHRRRRRRVADAPRRPYATVIGPVTCRGRPVSDTLARRQPAGPCHRWHPPTRPRGRGAPRRWGDRLRR
jgi:hypothetical protein